MTECIWCGLEVTQIRDQLVTWTGSPECPGRTITQSPHGAHEIPTGGK